MSDTFVLIVFLALLLGIILGRHSIAIICWLISGHIDLGVGSIGGSGAQKGILNGVKVIGFPFLLYLRNWRVNFRNIKLNTTIMLWLAFLFYAIISLIWTPEKYISAGIKQTGYLISYTIGFVALYNGWKSNKLTTKSIKILIIVASTLAIAQTYFLGNSFGSTLNYSRYVSFTSKQQFGEFLFAIIALVLCLPDLKMRTKAVLLFVLIVQLLLNGSRTGLIAVLLAFSAHLVIRKDIKGVISFFALISVLLVLFIGKDMFISFADNMTKGSRLNELVSKNDKQISVKSIGTLNARITFWGNTLDYMKHWKMKHLVFGKGLSSVGTMTPDTTYSRLLGITVSSDSNRTMHNEYIRTAFELGFIGISLFFAFLTSVLITLTSRMTPSHVRRLAFSFMPGFLLFLFTENIFIGSGSAGGIGFLLVLSYMFSQKTLRAK